VYFENAHLSKESSMNVGSAINYFVKNNIDNSYFQLIAVDSNGNEVELLIRPMHGQDFYINADLSQFVKCIDRDGRRVDVVIPRPELRDSKPALVVIEQLPEK